MNNAFFGKTMENIQDRLNVEYISHSEAQHFIHRHCKLSFKCSVDRYEKFSVYKYYTERIIFLKPFVFGFSVLELGKLLLYEIY